jgi:hypothetical protein
MPKYFTFEELWQSATADKLGIDNKPSAEIAFRLGFLAADLDAIREAWKSGIIVSSGYRCPELNEAVGGSETSAHKLGWAVDLQPANGEIEKFKVFMVDYFKDKPFDQLLLESAGKIQWIHYGKYNRKGQQRKQCFKIEQ